MDALFVAADGFDAREHLYVAERLRQEDVTVDVASTKGTVSGSGDGVFCVDAPLSETDAGDYELLHVTGGDRTDEEREAAATAVAEAAPDGAYVTASGEGVLVLVEADEAEGRQVAATGDTAASVEDAGGRAYDEPVIVDGRFVTTLGGEALPGFGAELVRKVRRARVKDI